MNPDQAKAAVVVECVMVRGKVVYPGSRVSDVLIGGTVLKVPNGELFPTSAESSRLGEGLTDAELNALKWAEACVKGAKLNGSPGAVNTLDVEVICAALRRLSAPASRLRGSDG